MPRDRSSPHLTPTPARDPPRTLRRVLYRTIVGVARRLLPLAGRFSDKLDRGVAGRRGAVERMVDWATSQRDARRPLIWLHAPSVGEALMAQAIAGALRAERPDTQIVFTHFSPSAERVRDQVGADIADYLPWDHPEDLAPVLDAVHPTVIVFVRTEIWPELMRQAAMRGAPSLLVNGVIGEDSGRLSTAGRWILGAAYRELAAIGVVGEEDRALFSRLGVDPSRVIVTGDARIDQVLARLETMQTARSAGLGLLGTERSAFTVVAGSTWPEDEEHLIPAVAEARTLDPIRLVIAPHEPTAHEIERLSRRLRAAGLRPRLLSGIEQGAPVQSEATVRVHSEAALPEVLILDRLGVLADAYAAGHAAYVGGGFGDDGLHSVVEPAALGVPVIFGSRHGNTREAGGLRDAGGGIEVHDRDELCFAITGLARAPEAAGTIGAVARRFVEERRGGARRNAGLIA
ncbi:MAG: 3-deoxy-D-manno-octulosonic acid transferase, partial [Longimicrobiales bacterium]